jgi:hypothetical protein
MYPRGTLADYLADRVVYRNLKPADESLPALEDVWQAVGLEALRLPRKTEPAYAAVVMRLLEAAQAARGALPLRNLLFIGDTALNDGTAARNLAAHLPLRGFIGADRLEEPAQVCYEDLLMIGNRWRQLPDWLSWARQEGLVPDERTAVLVDIDKTFIGARGRNDGVIDGARVAAVRLTMEEALGGGFDEERFTAVYGRLHQSQYHHLTADNQDYLAYISLMVMGGVFPATEFWSELGAGHMTGFTQFVTICDARRGRMADGLAAVHREVVGHMRQGDPTPFKSFRYREFVTTVGRMDCLPDDRPRDELLANEILITQEVAEIVRRLAEQGALTFGMSDKPDEASNPPACLTTLPQARPIHRVVMKIVGST